jgi:hypothetical protein
MYLRVVNFSLSRITTAALVAGLTLTAATACKKKVAHTELPLSSAPLADSVTTARLPSAGTLAFVEGNTVRIAGHFLDDCPADQGRPCTAQYRFAPTDISITLPPAPIGDSTFLTSPEGSAAVAARRAALAKLIEGLQPVLSQQQAFRADAGASSSSSLVVAAPPTTVAWIVRDIIYASQRAGFDSTVFAVRGPHGPAAITLAMPARPVTRTPSNFLVTRTETGIDVTTPSGHVGPGCEGSEPGVTLPGPDLDLVALGRCAAKLRQTQRGLGSTAEILTLSTTSLQQIVRLVDTLARSPDGSAMFIDIRFHAPEPVAQTLPFGVRPTALQTPSALVPSPSSITSSGRP